MIYHDKQRCLHRCLLQLKTNAEKRNLRGTYETKASKAGIILSILLVILATGYFAGTWYLKQKNEGTKQTTAQADGQKAEADKEQAAGARSDLQTEYDTILEKCQKEFISNRPIDEKFFGLVSF